ncbi:MAG TPA: hypothetical protein VE971_00785, partial [Candidatus Eisenbacteria bacterium]|nr:hypothetical protein [Candidatus Eisenbacteria bacterium]
MAKSNSVLLAVITMLSVIFSWIAIAPLSSVDAHRWHSSDVGSWDQQCCILHIPDHLFTPP